MSDPVTVLYFYRTTWGGHDEFVELDRKSTRLNSSHG